MKRNKNISNSKLCYFSSLDYIVLASSLAIALSEELNSNDINILATFFAVLSDELALISSIQQCSSPEDDESFVDPIPDTAITRNNLNKTVYKNNRYKKKIIKKKE